jgi:hypothetical protein
LKVSSTLPMIRHQWSSTEHRSGPWEGTTSMQETAYWHTRITVLVVMALCSYCRRKWRHGTQYLLFMAALGLQNVAAQCSVLSV